MNESTRDPASTASRRWYRAFSCHMTDRDRHNARRTNWWLFFWMLSFLGIMAAIRFDVLHQGVPAYLAIAGSTLLGAVAILAFARYIREADELVRKIQIEALALGFGAGFLLNFTLSLIERLTEQTFEIGDVFLVMIAFYVIGVITGTRRYR